MPLSLTTKQRRTLSLLTALAVVLGVGCLSPFTVVAQDAPPKSDLKFIGIAGCALCHNQQLPKAGATVSALHRDLSALDEFDVFTSRDKHSKAYELLKGDLGQKMEKILGYKVTENKLCLACHANWHWKEGFDRPRVYEEGVTCESCHGPASKWQKKHYDLDSPDDFEWRKLSPQEKESKHGFIDVRNPVRRAQQCFSCHVGNVKEGKVVTHEMYAAGHPPLPSIEMETFINDMPSHWRTVRDRGEFMLEKEYLAANFPGQKAPKADLPRTKATLIGGVMALRESLNLFGEQAIDKTESAMWPELAVFDCAACHHDLRGKSWRRDRGYGTSIPGRPQFFAWPTALVKVAIRHRAGSDDKAFQTQWDEFHLNLEKLRRVLDKQPFGNPQQVHAITHGAGEAKGLVQWLDKLADDIFNSPVQEPEANRALRALVTLSKTDYPDFHSARQTLWAFRTIQSELGVEYPKYKTPATDETPKQSQSRAIENLLLYRDWETGPKAASYAKTDSQLTAQTFDKTLRLKLPAGLKNVIAEQLPETLEAAATYDPDAFREQLAKLAKDLPKE